MKKYLYLLVILAICAFVAKTAWDMGRQYEGVCLEKGRALTDEEKIRALVKEINKRPMVPIDFISYKSIPSASVDEFLKENTNCCKVEYYNMESRSLDKAIGAYAGHVTVNYTVRYLDENGVERQKLLTVTRTIENCGHVN